MSVCRLLSLNEIQLAEINELVGLCEKEDHAPGRIQFETSLNFFSEMNCWFLYYVEERLVGVISIFAPQNDQAEISACVLPEKRRQGIFSSLLKEVYNELHKFGVKRVLFMNDRYSLQGKEVITRKGGVYKFTEYTMRYEKKEEVCIECVDRIEVSEAREDDIEDMIKVSIYAFDGSYENAKNLLRNNMTLNNRKQFVAKLDNKIIGICSLAFETEAVSIHGLVIAKEYQGMGYGKELLEKIIGMLSNGKYEIMLDVDSVNNVAYNLYKKIGFQEVSTVDYYEKLL